MIIRRRNTLTRPSRYPMPSYPLAGTPNNAVEEQRGVGELPEDLMSERLLRDPIFSPRMGWIPGQGSVIIPPNNAGTGLPFNPRYKSSVVPFLTLTSSQKALPANAARAYLLVQNNDGGGNSVFVNFGADASSTSGIKIIDGGNLIFEGGNEGGSFVPQEDVYIIGTVAGSACIVMEGLTYAP
jgi:hypothetical protein